MKRNYGFTLIELLVIIAIIAILAAILFPVFAKVREKARQTTCLSNEKQLGLGMMQYEQDYDETFPMDSNQGKAWSTFIQPYLKNGDTTVNGIFGGTGVFACPSFPGPVQSFNYGVRWDLCPDGQAPGTPTPVQTLAVVDSPADKLLIVEKGRNDEDWGWPMWLVDEGLFTGNIGGDPPTIANAAHKDIDTTQHHDCDWPSTTNSYSWGACGQMPRYRHNNTMNGLFIDGHVKAFVRGNLDWYKNVYIKGVDPIPS